jgi:hypothetical protein
MTITATAHSNFLVMQPSDQRWQEYIKSDVNATIFHHPAWIRLLADCYGFQSFVSVVCNSAGKIRAGIPIMDIKSKLTGRRWVSLPFSDYCNPLFDDSLWLTHLTVGLIQLSKEKNIPRFELRWKLPPNDLVNPTSRYVLHILKLDPDIERVLKGVHRTQYQNVRRAEREGITVEKGKDIDAMRSFYYLHCLTRRRHGLPVQPWKFFEQLYYQLLEKGLGFILLAKQSDRYLAAGIFLCTHETLTYKYAASHSKENQFIRSNHLLTWSAIRWGCNNGFKNFDFGRSNVKDTGLRTFKIRWGAQETTLHYSYFFDSPQPTDSRLLPVMQFFIRRSPLWVGTMMGEVLYKYFG